VDFLATGDAVQNPAVVVDATEGVDIVGYDEEARGGMKNKNYVCQHHTPVYENASGQR
jgi:hypothetical protein